MGRKAGLIARPPCEPGVVSSAEVGLPVKIRCPEGIENAYRASIYVTFRNLMIASSAAMALLASANIADAGYVQSWLDSKGGCQPGRCN